MKIFPRIMRRALSALLKMKEGNPRHVPSAMEVVTNIMSFPVLLETQLDKWENFTLNNKTTTEVITPQMELIKNQAKEVIGFQKDGFTVLFKPFNNKRNINVSTIVAHKDDLCRKIYDHTACCEKDEEGKDWEEMTDPAQRISINKGHRPNQDYDFSMSHHEYLIASTAKKELANYGLSPYHDAQTTWSERNELVVSMTLPSTFVQLAFLTEFRENLNYFMMIARAIKSHAVQSLPPLPPSKMKIETQILDMLSLHSQSSFPSVLSPIK